ncbi:MAG: tRNA dimethylallyltransferase 2 [Candidatus Giovannonibacteria bacterium GW2011_GWC2_44_9]|uniref:tRNA dimethylallyltransferase n=3 Tax=Candidatus Giovannoniibacteriota TaxID=1752738 RepID=A0A0G1IYB8_9BACT|nr:MAG: tRNA dimethylallyltransferase 2 [Candidatus Giovannonibacteria bacterium GW2011_GWB1_44_23]KKT63988.1 MAG: tRNA dimethylallyltransferase 2 [Candidatus Giovannonibacteria bacterium GW2011_GWA1_44_29]KKT83585.1 MAG: tRNA dimethylallyltransferase 2 [Candidatus Giovannonibacteria bacterium GW2011_GWC2_44_9]KKT91181.1 MAG: tRNA dimethylallyltransferase 2 [Parcubacteria group bacterium GW2011_GWC1_45_13]
MSSKQKLIVIVGPTASGKSKLAVTLAQKIGGEIISADSRQIYKGLNIGSGKITKKEMRGVLHHCLSVANPKKVFTALDFKKCAQKATTMIYHSSKIPIIVGGTGFYIDAALGRVKLGGVPPNRMLRKKLTGKSAAELLKMLKKIDPKRAKIIEQKNPRRLIRAIEIAAWKEKSHFVDFAGFASTQPRGPLGGREESKINKIAIIWLGIKRPPEELKKRIRTRLFRRLPGIVREVKKLRHGGLSWKRLYDLGLEYRYTSLYLRSKLDYKLMTTQLQTATWHYAKRQMTYFKKNKEIRWISLGKSVRFLSNF